MRKGILNVSVLDMVPLEPANALAAHDMLLRFIHVDTLYAAGEAASIPSRIGEETASVLSPTNPNGTTLIDLEAAALAAQAAVPKQLLEGGLDPVHEAYYGPRRSLGLFVLLGLFITATYWFFRWRGQRRRSRQMRKFGKSTRVSKSRASRSAGIRLEDEGHSPLPGSPEVDDQRASQVPLFELGDEEDELSEEEDEESEGDIGRGANPWQA